MARKRKELPIVEGVEIAGVAAEGKSIARIGDLVVFIPFGAPGDIADIKIDKKKRNYAEGHIVKMIKPSLRRVEPECSHFGVCGGCKWQHIPYDDQLEYKRNQVCDALQRIAKVDIPEVNPILGSSEIFHYRNKLEFTFSNKSWLTFEELQSGRDFPDRNALGFHIPGAFDKVLDIKKCWLQDDLSNEIRLFIREYALGKTSGKANIDRNLQELGLELTPEQTRLVTKRITELGDRKEIVTQEDLPFIVSDVLKHNVPDDRVKLVSYMVSSAYGLKPIASVKVEINKKQYEADAMGDGQYDAFVKALRKIYKKSLGRTFPVLENYSVTIPPGGRTDALVQTVITWNNNGKTIRTRGLDADQTEAAIKATFKMLNIFEEQNN